MSMFPNRQKCLMSMFPKAWSYRREISSFRHFSCDTEQHPNTKRAELLMS